MVASECPSEHPQERWERLGLCREGATRGGERGAVALLARFTKIVLWVGVIPEFLWVSHGNNVLWIWHLTSSWEKANNINCQITSKTSSRHQEQIGAMINSIQSRGHFRWMLLSTHAAKWVIGLALCGAVFLQINPQGEESLTSSEEMSLQASIKTCLRPSRNAMAAPCWRKDILCRPFRQHCASEWMGNRSGSAAKHPTTAGAW